MDKVLFSKNTDEWETPMSLFNIVNNEFNFTLDVASTSRNKKCFEHFTLEDNALNQKWYGNIWCNPPYSDIKGFLNKAVEEINNYNLAVFLIPSRTDTRYFHDLIFPHAYEIRFIKSRLKFSSSKNSAPFPSMLVIFNKGLKNTDRLKVMEVKKIEKLSRKSN